MAKPVLIHSCAGRIGHGIYSVSSSYSVSLNVWIVVDNTLCAARAFWRNVFEPLYYAHELLLRLTHHSRCRNREDLPDKALRETPIAITAHHKESTCL